MVARLALLVLLGVMPSSGLIHNTNCVLTTDGNVRCWGHCNPNCGIGTVGFVGLAVGDMGDNTAKPDLGTDANGQSIAVSSGLRSACALFENGRIKCWGAGAKGQLGSGDTSDRYDVTQMGDNLPWVDLGIGATAIAVESGWDFHCAILSDGGVKCWGDGKKRKSCMHLEHRRPSACSRRKRVVPCCSTDVSGRTHGRLSLTLHRLAACALLGSWDGNVGQPR